MMCLKKIVVIFLCSMGFGNSFAANNVPQKLTEKFAWKSIEYAWISDAAKQDAIQNGHYVPQNNLPFSLDIWGDKLFIAVPRYDMTVYRRS